MFGNLKKFKLESGGEYLHLANAVADNVTILNRFAGKSEPTWLFIGSGHLVKVIFGSNAPRLLKEIARELEKELKVMAGELEREAFPFDEPTEAELERNRLLEERREADAKAEAQKLEEQLDKIKRVTLERIARELIRQTVILFFPSTIKEPTEHVKKRICTPAYQLMAQYDNVQMSVIDQLDHLITRDIIPELFYNTNIEIPESMLKIMEERPCMAVLLQEINFMISSEEEDVADDAAGPPPSISELLGTVETKVATLLYGGLDPMDPQPGTIGKNFMYTDKEDKSCPGVWTPVDFISKAAAMKILFPKVVERLKIKEEQFPPPSYVMAFDATKAREVLDGAKQFEEDILHVGYFDSQDPDKANKIAKTIYDLDRLPPSKLEDAKIVLALQKTRSDPMLMLAQLGPTYISADTHIGTVDAEKFFPRKVIEEVEPDPWGSPPSEPEEAYPIDEEGNEYVEELVEDPDGGEAVLMKRIVKWADGTVAEQGTYLPLIAAPAEEAQAVPSEDLSDSEDPLV